MRRKVAATTWLIAAFAIAPAPSSHADEWQSPGDDILEVLHAPTLPVVFTSPDGEYMLMGDRVLYPPLEELAAPMHKLAGMRINPALNHVHGRHGFTSPRIVSVADGTVVPLNIPRGYELLGVRFSTDGERLAMYVAGTDHIGLWVGSVFGEVREIEGLELNPLMASPVEWTPDQEMIRVMAVPDRGPAPEAPAVPAGPEIMEGLGSTARSTYEARDLLETAYDDQLFEYYFTSVPALVDPESGDVTVIGEPRPYFNVDYSPDGGYILAEYLEEPWSHEVSWWRFAQRAEIWDSTGGKVAEVASLPLADAVPIHGVPEGPRGIIWRPTAPHQLYWTEALDGGDPVAEVPNRDRLMRLDAPFTGEPEEVFRAEHRIQTWRMAWGEGGTLMLTERERMRRWRYVWLLDVDTGTERLWYDMNESDYYGDPGYPVHRQLENGRWIMHQEEGGIYFAGNGATEEGYRPFLDLRSMETGETERLFRCDPDRYESFVSFHGTDGEFLVRSESNRDVPNYYLASPGEAAEDVEEGEAGWTLTMEPVTFFEDPTPVLRDIHVEIVRYERADGVPLSFRLYLPPDYQEGTPLPTVLNAYPLEYSGAETAGQVRGTDNAFMRIYGASHLFFLLRGYAILDWAAMPVIGDPETAYDTFVEQLVADAEAAVNKAVEMGVADPDRIGIIGHSHGALMVANLLAHSDLFSAGIARSGSYNKTNQPFGFQSERRSLFEARDTYIQVSPTFFADMIDEPLLLVHGKDDSNPGTRTFQSEVLYEAVRGCGGTTRLILLPYEDHGYMARESVEHLLWEQLRWFDMYVGNAGSE